MLCGLHRLLNLSEQFGWGWSSWLSSPPRRPLFPQPLPSGLGHCPQTLSPSPEDTLRPRLWPLHLEDALLPLGPPLPGFSPTSSHPPRLPGVPSLRLPDAPGSTTQPLAPSFPAGGRALRRALVISVLSAPNPPSSGSTYPAASCASQPAWPRLVESSLLARAFRRPAGSPVAHRAVPA